MSSPAVIPHNQKSQHVCLSCRTRKQRCDKQLPSCSRCASKLFDCDYSWVDTHVEEQNQRTNGSAAASPLLVPRCPSCLDLSNYAARELLQATVTNPDTSYLAKLIAEILEAAQITVSSLLDEFHGSLHRRLPIIDQENLCSRLGSWPRSGDVGLTTLVWALYLVTRLPCPNCNNSMRSLLYQTTKQVFMLQASGGMTLQLLQAGLLVAYYECGHGLPREAHLTLANCVTISRLIGLDFEDLYNQQHLDAERAACRLAVVLLDRTVAVSGLDYPLPLVLPASLTSNINDVASILDSNSAYPMFHITSKVAWAVGAAIDYANKPRSIHLNGSVYRDTYDRTEILVRDLIHAAGTARDSYVFCEGTSLAVSALFALQAASLGNEPKESNLRETLHFQSMIRIVRDMYQEATHIISRKGPNGMVAGPSSLSSTAVCALARASAMYVRLCGSELLNEDLDMLRYNLRSFASRWAVGYSYLRDFEAVVQSSKIPGVAAPTPSFHLDGAKELV